jgi:hypothetical protein
VRERARHPPLHRAARRALAERQEHVVVDLGTLAAHEPRPQAQDDDRRAEVELRDVVRRPAVARAARDVPPPLFQQPLTNSDAVDERVQPALEEPVRVPVLSGSLAAEHEDAISAALVDP